MGETVKLVTRPAVPILDTGTFDLASGETTFTVDDLAAAVEAQSCPAIRTPVLKLGHVDPRFDGQPAVGRIEAMRVSTNGQTLVADFEGMPEWLADILPSAYPSRSIEGEFDYVCAAGHTHRLVITAVALLGVTPPGVGTLADIADLYGIAAREGAHGRPITLTLPEKPMPVRAAVPESAIYEEFYENAPPGSWAWIRDVWVGDGAFIIVDDGDGDLWRIPYTESNGDISFGTPEKVVIEYVPAPADDESDDKTLTLAARNWGAGGPKTVAASAANNPAKPDTKGASDMDLAKLRTRLGLPDDASEEDIEAKLTELEDAATKPAPPAPKPELPEGVVAIDESTLEDLKVAAASGKEARDILRRQDRDAFLAGAVQAGKFSPARREHFERLYDADPDGTKDLVAKLAANTVPVTELGNGSVGDTTDDALFASLYPDLVKEPSNG